MPVTMMPTTDAESSADDRAKIKELSIQPYKEQIGSLMKDLRTREHEFLDTSTGLEQAYFSQVNKRNHHFEAAKKIVANSLNQLIQNMVLLGNKMLTLVDQQKEQIESLESDVNILNQAMDMHKDRVAMQQYQSLGVARDPPRRPKKDTIKEKSKSVRYTRKPIDFSDLDGVGHGVKSKVGQIRGKRAESLQPRVNRAATITAAGRTRNGSMDTGTSSLKYGRRKSGSISSVNSNTSQPTSSNSSEMNESPRQSRSSSIRSTQSGTSSGTVSVVQTKKVHEKPTYQQTGLRTRSSESLNSQSSADSSSANKRLPINVFKASLKTSEEEEDGSVHPPQSFKPALKMEDLPPPVDQDFVDFPPAPDDDMPLPPPPIAGDIDEDDSLDIPPPPPLNIDADDIPVPPPPMLKPDSPNVEVDWVPTKYIRKVVAMYDYQKRRNDELDLKEGDVIYVIKENVDGWFEGSISGQIGKFPGNYVEDED